MDQDLGAHFETVISLARARLTHVEVIQNDVTPSRSILELHGRFRGLDARVKEIHAASGVLYAYYLLKDGVVIVGFDNYPDVRVIRAKFQRQYKGHLGIPIPHRHGHGKQTVELTSEYSAKRFFEELEQLASWL